MRIEPHQVHVWHATFLPEQPSQLNETQILDDAEIARAHRFRFAVHKNRYLHAHVLLRKILSCYLDCNPKSICFIKDTHGKPLIAFPNNSLQFNLSHSENEFICALHSHHPVGIDIEIIKPAVDLTLAQRYFTDTEYQSLLNCDDNEKASAFYFLWTAKEAIIKAAGLALIASLKQFSINLDQKTQLVSFNNTTWLLNELDNLNECKTTLASHKSVTDIVYCGFDQNVPLIKKTHAIYLGKNI